jgi:hypothetical protein
VSNGRSVVWVSRVSLVLSAALVLFGLAWVLGMCGAGIAQDMTIALVAPYVVGFAMYIMDRAATGKT